MILVEKSEGEAMHTKRIPDRISSYDDETSQNMYGCLFRMTGKEQGVAEQIQTNWLNMC